MAINYTVYTGELPDRDNGSNVTNLPVDGKGRLIVSGSAGGGGASAEYNATLPTYADGADATLQTNQMGVLLVGLTDLTGAQGDLTDLGRQAANQSVSTALSTEDKTALDLMSSVSSAITAAGTLALSTTAATVRAANTSRRFIEVRNIDAAIDIAVGASGVTMSTGFTLKPGQSLRLERLTAAIVAIAASGTPSISYIEY